MCRLYIPSVLACSSLHALSQTLCASSLWCPADMQGTAPDKEVLELFALARSRLDAPLLGSFVNSSSGPQAPAAAAAAAAAAAPPVEVTRVVASIARPNTVKIHQMAKSVLQERDDNRWVLALGNPCILPC